MPLPLLERSPKEIAQMIKSKIEEIPDIKGCRQVNVRMAGKMIQMNPIAVPGMLGIYEAAVTTSLSLFAVPVAVAASAALLMRIITFWPDLPITGLAAYHYGFKLLSGHASSIRS
jgi:hypothetical protein